MTCVTSAFKETDACMEPREAVTQPPTTTTTVAQCSLQPVPGEPQYFLNGGIQQYCGDNMQFDFNICTCIPASADIVCDSDVLLYFPFDEDLHDHSCNMAVSQQTSEASVVLATDPQRGTVAYFNGASSLHVGYIYNWFADKTVTSWSVAMWFKREGSTEVLGGLLNNGDCVGSPSFGLNAGLGQTGSVSVDTDGVATMAAIRNVQVGHDEWQHIAMVYDGSSLQMYLNGVSVQSMAVTGAIENRQCAMNIGAEHAGMDYFQGYMDEIYIYERALSSDEVTTLYGM